MSVPSEPGVYSRLKPGASPLPSLILRLLPDGRPSTWKNAGRAEPPIVAGTRESEQVCSARTVASHSAPFRPMVVRIELAGACRAEGTGWPWMAIWWRFRPKLP